MKPLFAIVALSLLALPLCAADCETIQKSKEIGHAMATANTQFVVTPAVNLEDVAEGDTQAVDNSVPPETEGPAVSAPVASTKSSKAVKSSRRVRVASGWQPFQPVRNVLRAASNVRGNRLQARANRLERRQARCSRALGRMRARGRR